MSLVEAPVSRREMNKERTRDALTRAAQELLGEVGAEGLTAEAIASRAGVSRRTFFNYFARVEDVVTHTCRMMTRHTMQRLLARPADEPLIDSVRAILVDLGHDELPVSVIHVDRAALTSPTVRAFLREYQEEQAEAIAEALAIRLGPDADPVYIATVSASVAAVVAGVPRVCVAAATPGETDAQIIDRTHSAVVTALGWLCEGLAMIDPTKD